MKGFVDRGHCVGILSKATARPMFRSRRCAKAEGAFAIGESEPESRNQGPDIDEKIEIQRGVYQDQYGAIYEVLMTAESGEDSELVVYRELFGDYKFRVAPTENFSASSDSPQFRLIKNL
jgi:hypothetical protein